MAYQQLLVDMNIDLTYENDLWTYIWGNGNFSSRKIYAMNFAHTQSPIYLSWIWKSNFTVKIKVFGWLRLIDRLNTRDMLDRKPVPRMEFL